MSTKYYNARNAAEALYAEYCANTKAPRGKRSEPRDAYAEYAKTAWPENFYDLFPDGEPSDPQA